jgi:hypothetical protein
LRKIVSVAMIIAGLAGAGFIVGIIGGYMGAASGTNDYTGFQSLAGTIIGTMAGYPVGVALGLLVLRKLFKVFGSMLFGIIGAVAGVLVVLVLAEPLHINLYSTGIVTFFILTPPVLATIGYFYKRIIPRRKGPASS